MKIKIIFAMIMIIVTVQAGVQDLLYGISRNIKRNPYSTAAMVGGATGFLMCMKIKSKIHNSFLEDLYKQLNITRESTDEEVKDVLEKLSLEQKKDIVTRFVVKTRPFFIGQVGFLILGMYGFTKVIGL